MVRASTHPTRPGQACPGLNGGRGVTCVGRVGKCHSRAGMAAHTGTLHALGGDNGLQGFAAALSIFSMVAFLAKSWAVLPSLICSSVLAPFASSASMIVP